MHYETFSEQNFKGGAITQQGVRTVSCKISADIHSSNTLKQAAIAEVYADALLSGAGKYSREAFIDAVNLLGAAIGIQVHHGIVTFTLRTTAEHAQALMKLFTVMVNEPHFAQKELTRIQKQTHNELQEHTENARSIAHERLISSLYSKTDRRFHFTPKQLQKALQEVTTEDLRMYHDQVRHTLWSVTIGANPTTAKLVQDMIAKCVLNTVAKKRTHMQKAATRSTILENISSKQNIEFSIGAPLPLTIHHPDYLPFLFGLNVLGKWGGFTGRLMSTVREKEGLTYSIYAQTQSVMGTEQGYWRIMTFFAPGQAKKGLMSTLREIKKIHEKGITEAELKRFRIILHTQQTLLADSLDRSVESFHAYLCADFSIEEMQQHKAKLLQVTQKEVNMALKKYLNPKKICISGAGPITAVKSDLLAI